MENRTLHQWLAGLDDWLNFVPDAVMVVDPGGKIVLVNRQAEQMFRLSGTELCGQMVESLIPERHRFLHQTHRQHYGRAPHVRAMGIVSELTALRGDGSEFPVEISLGPIPASEGAAVFVVIRDLSERRRIESVLREHQSQILAARTIQEQQLPSRAPEIVGYDIAGILRPAEPAGGDSFDFFSLQNGCLAVVVSDVAGQGLGPVKFMAAMHRRLRHSATTNSDLGQILQAANAVGFGETESPTFATAYLGSLNPAHRIWQYASAGHTVGYVLDRHGEVRTRMEATSIPLAISPETTFPVSDPIALEDGDILVLPTNGVLESRNAVGEPFGATGCLSLIHRMRQRPAKEILDRLLETVQQYSAGDDQVDDLTAVLIKVGDDPVASLTQLREDRPLMNANQR